MFRNKSSSRDQEQEKLVIMPSIPQLSWWSTPRYLMTTTSNKSPLSSSELLTFSVNPPSIAGKKSRPIDGPSVRFDLSANSVHEIRSRREISPDNAIQLWHSSNEIKVIKSRIQTSIRMMNSGRFDGESDDYSFRGIQTEAQMIQRRERVAKQIMEVFWCTTSEYCDRAHEVVSLKLQELSRTAVSEAIVRATRDRKDALKVYRRSGSN
jgi:hypothetical protein